MMQVKFLAELCWCHVDEQREWAENERVPMKWETALFPKFAELLDHIHAGAWPSHFVSCLGTCPRGRIPAFCVMTVSDADRTIQQ